jgi:hypothetical protein
VIARLMKRLEMHERDGQRLPAQRKQARHAAKNRRVKKTAVDRRRQDARTDNRRQQSRQQKGFDKVRILLRNTSMKANDRTVVDARAFLVFKLQEYDWDAKINVDARKYKKLYDKRCKFQTCPVCGIEDACEKFSKKYSMDGDARQHPRQSVDDECKKWRAMLEQTVAEEFGSAPDMRGLTSIGVLPMPGARPPICKECVGAFKQGDIPPLALVRGHWPGDVPEALAVLNRTELSMIALVNPITHVTMLPEAKAQAWHSVKGKSKVFSVVNDAAQFVQRLPRMPTIDSQAIFVNKNCKAPQELGFRPQRVVAAFDWLKENNHLYQDAEFDVAFRAMAAAERAPDGGDVADEQVHLPPVLEVDDDEHEAMEEAVTAAAQTEIQQAAPLPAAGIFVNQKLNSATARE